MIKPALILFLIMVWLMPQSYARMISGSEIPETSVSFTSSDPKLQRLYEVAVEKAHWNIAEFGKYQVLVEGAGYKNVWLETQPMGGYMYGKRDLNVARNNIQIFMDNQRMDGRLPGMLSVNQGILTAHYGWFQGYCFPMPAFELYFWLGKDKTYLLKLYDTLEKFDNYLWETRDSDHDGCLETWCIWDTGEDECTRLGDSPNSWTLDVAPSIERIKSMTREEKQKYCSKTNFTFSKFPVPIESMDIMSYSYSGRDVLAKIAKELNNGKESYWRNKANQVREKIKTYLWNAEKHACYDRDNENKTMDILLHNNLRCMYFGSFDQQMANEFVKYHLMNPKEFWTPMPLPSIAASDAFFKNVSGNNWSGQPQGLTFQRSISALENYGHWAELTLIGQKFLKVVGKSLKFTQQFDPFTGTANDTKDGYGPSILASLEFISRMYGIHLTQDQIYWSCLDGEADYDYMQKWGKHTFRMKTMGKEVHCSIDGNEVFSFSKGIRIVSDLQGNIVYVAGIEPREISAHITFQKKRHTLEVSPNGRYEFDSKFHLSTKVEFISPGNFSTLKSAAK